MGENLIIAGVAFARHTVGIIRKPYETYRDIIERGKPYELLYIALISAAYFALASLVKTAAFRPFLLTKHFIVLAGWAGVSYIIVLSIFWFIGKWFGGKGEFFRVAIAWGYTLIPTVTWFFMTSLLFVILPPPRTTAFSGMLFSIVYLVCSATLLWWKMTLSYLTLRFGLKLDLGKIIKVSLICLPLLFFWSYFLYKVGIFRVPFL